MRFDQETREYIWMLNWYENFGTKGISPDVLREFDNRFGHGYTRIFSKLHRRKYQYIKVIESSRPDILWQITEAGLAFINRFANTRLKDVLFKTKEDEE